jgi:hypothetical protein
MRLFRMAALAAMAALGKKVYDEARKPENQRKIKEQIEAAKQRRAQSRGQTPL